MSVILLAIIALLLVFSVLVAFLVLPPPHTRPEPVLPDQRSIPRRSISKKTIWLLWMQGWNDETPWVVRQVRQSWEAFNRDWNVVALDEVSLEKYVDVSEDSCLKKMIRNRVGMAPISDMIRLSLLYEHGGVWADATMMCMHPLDDWIYEALVPCGLWMYHGRDRGDGPASGFIISTCHSYITAKWLEEGIAHWETSGYKESTKGYFWLDSIFADLLLKDPDFENQWKKVPYLWCESYGQAHMLVGRLQEPCADETKALLLYSPPYVLKLSHNFDAARSGKGQGFEKTNLWHAVAASRKRQEALPPWEFEHALSPKNSPLARGDPGELPIASTVLVVADCGCADSTATIMDISRRHSITPLFYDKCGFCAHTPKGAYSRPLKNVGRDLHTFCWFVARYYDHLPPIMYFLAGNVKRHDRATRLEKLITGKGNNASDLLDAKDFTLTHYAGDKMRPASVRPMKAWYEKFVGDWDVNSTICYNAILRTTADKIRRRKRHVYVNICNELELDNNAEAVHFMERAVYSVFTSE